MKSYETEFSMVAMDPPHKYRSGCGSHDFRRRDLFKSKDGAYRDEHVFIWVYSLDDYSPAECRRSNVAECAPCYVGSAHSEMYHDRSIQEHRERKTEHESRLRELKGEGYDK